MQPRPPQPTALSYLLLLTTLLVSALLVGCTARPLGASAASLDGCELPCWQGIMPHSTRVVEARATLERLYDAEHVAQVADVIMWRADDGSEGRLAVEGEQAGTIMLQFPESMLTVEALVDQVGPPALVHVTLPHPRHSPDPANPQCEVLQLVYPDANVEVRVYGSRSGRVEAGQSVYRLYLDPQRPELTIQAPHYAREWSGYGDYCIAVKDIFD